MRTIILVVLAWLLYAAFVAAQFPEPELTPEQQAKLAERNQLWEQAGELWKKQDYEGAMKAYENALSITRDIFGEQHKQVVRYMRGVANGYERLSDFENAERLFAQIVEIQTVRFGKDHWETIDARRALDDLRFRWKLTPAQEYQLDKAILLRDQSDQLYREGRFEEGLTALGLNNYFQIRCDRILQVAIERLKC